MEYLNIKGTPVNKNNYDSPYFRPAVYALAIKNRKILVTRPIWDNKYCLPGGGLELEESFIEALNRECLEEVNCKIKLKNTQPIYVETKLFTNPKSKNRSHQKLNFYFEVEIIEELDDMNLDEDTIDFFWVEIDKLKPKDFTFFQQEFMKTVLKK